MRLLINDANYEYLINVSIFLYNLYLCMHDYDVFFMRDIPDMIKRFIYNDDMVNIWKD